MGTSITLAGMVSTVVVKKKQMSTQVILAWSAFPEVKQTNVALQNMGDDGRLEFLRLFRDQWFGSICGEKEAREAAVADLHQILGDKADKWFGMRLLYTLTPNGRQFRCWYGIPGSISYTHVDSCGAGLLFEVCGVSESVKKYVDALLPEIVRERAITLPMGVKIYGFFWPPYA